MTDQNLQIEIDEATSRIESRQRQIDAELDTLATKITQFTNWAWAFVWFGVAVAIIAIFIYLCENTETGFGLNLLGDFMAGTVASIWSLAGLFFIYVAFLGQKQQLLNQQLEIMYSQLEVKYTRLELAGQKQEMKEQNETLRQQKFENTFFQLLNLFSSIVNSLDLRKLTSKTDVISTGRDCFEIFYTRLQATLRGNKQHISDFTIRSSSAQQAIKAYGQFYDNNKSDMSHYFRSLYHIIKFVDKSNIENKKQRFNGLIPFVVNRLQWG